MPEQFSRRAFLAGALAVGTISAVTTYFVPGGSQPSQAELRLLTGVDTSGSRDLLIEMWNKANPRTQVKPIVISSSTTDQLDAMVGEAEKGTAAILNLDIIDLPMFQSRSLVDRIELDDRKRFLSNPLHACTLGDGSPTATIWAAPYNADVGVLFSRGPQTRSLLQVLDDPSPDRSPQLAAQLDPDSTAFGEAFAVNVLEQALWRNRTILGDGSGVVLGPDRRGLPSPAPEVWQQALEPLRRAVRANRILRSGSEDETRDQYIHTPVPYMRNWPVKYREMQRIGEPDAVSRRMTVDPLPRGILGGQCLAVVANSPLSSRAADFIRFMVSDNAQRILTAYGVAAAHSAGYADDLKVFVPHLDQLRGAIETAALRPIHPNYRAFSDAIYTYVKPTLDDDSQPWSDFVQRSQAALR